MRYIVSKNKIVIFGKEDFNIWDILQCGQIFSYEKCGEVWKVYSKDKLADVVETKDGYVINTQDIHYFENFFDLKTDYGQIKKKLSKFDILKNPIKFGSGIRILKQDLFETLISFIVSANNNIKRIQSILFKLRQTLGTDMGSYHAFPTRAQLLQVDESFFTQLGAGYRDKYIYKVLRQVDEDTLQQWQVLPTDELRNKLISLAGVGPKVADCVLLFGFGRGDVFPVDTWIEKMYNKFYSPLDNREKIRQNLVKQFGFHSGYAQQYLFFYMRSGET